VRLFDPLFFPDPEPLGDLYDFITCTETIEHFHRPAEEFARLDRMLRPGGWLALMTCFQTDDHRFAAWHYRRDPTHGVFYREAPLRHIARRFGWTCEIPVKDVALMQKPSDAEAMAQATARLNALEERRIRTALDRMASGDYGYCVLSADVRRLKFFRRGLWGGQAYGRQIGTGW